MPLLVPGVEHSFRPPRIKLIGKACFSGRSEKEETIFVNFNFSPWIYQNLKTWPRLTRLEGRVMDFNQRRYRFVKNKRWLGKREQGWWGGIDDVRMTITNEYGVRKERLLVWEWLGNDSEEQEESEWEGEWLGNKKSEEMRNVKRMTMRNDKNILFFNGHLEINNFKNIPWFL